MIDRDESEQSQPIAAIVTIAITPIIVAQDAHEETSDMRRPQRYNQLYILGTGLKRERPDSMREWQVTSVMSPLIARGDNDETSLHHCARGKQAMRRPHATENLFFEALVSRESAARVRPKNKVV